MKYLLTCILFCLTSLAVADERTISISGTGVVPATPDVAYINFIIVNEHQTASGAMASNKDSMKNVFAALKKLKIADRDVCTNNFSLQQKYKYVRDEEPKFVGYVVSYNVKATIRNLDKIGDVLESLTKEGYVNVISGFYLDVLDKSKVMNEARILAVEDALEKAKVLASSSGAKLGTVQSISEQESYNSGPGSMYDRKAMSESAVHTKGERQFSVSVRLVISLEEKK